MATEFTAYPEGLDALTNPTQFDALDSAVVPHYAVESRQNDAIEALEAKVGINGSSNAASLDYKVSKLTQGLLGGASTGSGSPEGTVAAPAGCLYWDTSGASLYVKNAGTGNTNWLPAVTTTGGTVYTGTTSLTDATATPFVQVTLASGKYAALNVFFSVKMTVSSSNVAVLTDTFNVSVVSDTTQYLVNVSAVTESGNGNFTPTSIAFDVMDNNDGTFSVRANVTPGQGSGVTITADWQVWVNSDDTGLVVTPL